MADSLFSMPFACIFVPDFPVEALLRAEPELRSQPLAVLEGKAPLQKVFAVNENARRAGVIPECRKLQIEACSGLALRTRSLAQEAVCARRLAGLRAIVFAACGSCGLRHHRVGSCRTAVALWSSAKNRARYSTPCFRALGLEASVAVAGNPDTAALAARGFSGVTVIPEGKEAEQLGSLPVEVLFANSAQESGQLLETFNRWGIRKLRDLAALPDIALSERLGQAGIHLQKLARGATSRTLVPVEPPLVFEEVIELEYPLVLLEPLAFLLGRLLEQLCARLEARALATQELRLVWNWRMDGCGRNHASGEGTSRRSFQRTLRLPVPLLDSRNFSQTVAT